MERVVESTLALIGKNEKSTVLLKKRHMALEYLIVPSLQRRVNEILTHEVMQVTFLYNKALTQLEHVKQQYMEQIGNLRKEANGVYEELSEIKSALDVMLANDLSVDLKKAYEKSYRLMAEIEDVKRGIDSAENTLKNIAIKGESNVT
jgi:hypothetical protein